MFQRLALFVVCTVLLSGCGSKPYTLTHVVGDASFDGSPIPYGQVEFYPEDKSHPKGFAEIVDGQFDTSIEEGNDGIVLGKYEIRVSAYTGRAADEEDEVAAADAELPAPLFLGYPMKVEVTGETCQFEVPADAKGHGTGK